MLRRMVQALWHWLVFVEPETAGIVLLEAGFSETEVKCFAGRAFELLLARRRVMGKTK